MFKTPLANPTIKHPTQIDLTFKLVSLIGAGAAGQIYKAETSQGEVCVVKLQERLQPAEQDIINTIIKLKSKFNYTMKHYDLFFAEQQKQWCTVMEYAECGDLYSYIGRRDQKIGKNEQQNFITQVIIDVSQAILELNQNKIVHRDIKPENILITYIGKNQIARVKLVDFGIAKQLQQGNAFETPNIGTQSYSAPEIDKNEKYDFNIDVWSLGCIWYWLITGQDLFQKVNLEKKQDQVWINKQIESLDNLQIESWKKELMKKMLVVDGKSRINSQKLVDELRFQCDFSIEIPKSKDLDGYQRQINMVTDPQSKQVEDLKRKVEEYSSSNQAMQIDNQKQKQQIIEQSELLQQTIQRQESLKQENNLLTQQLIELKEKQSIEQGSLKNEIKLLTQKLSQLQEQKTKELEQLTMEINNLAQRLEDERELVQQHKKNIESLNQQQEKFQRVKELDAQKYLQLQKLANEKDSTIDQLKIQLCDNYLQWEQEKKTYLQNLSSNQIKEIKSTIETAQVAILQSVKAQKGYIAKPEREVTEKENLQILEYLKQFYQNFYYQFQFLSQSFISINQNIQMLLQKSASETQRNFDSQSTQQGYQANQQNSYKGEADRKPEDNAKKSIQFLSEYNLLQKIQEGIDQQKGLLLQLDTKMETYLQKNSQLDRLELNYGQRQMEDKISRQCGVNSQQEPELKQEDHRNQIQQESPSIPIVRTTQNILVNQVNQESVRQENVESKSVRKEISSKITVATISHDPMFSNEFKKELERQNQQSDPASSGIELSPSKEQSQDIDCSLNQGRQISDSKQSQQLKDFQQQLPKENEQTKSQKEESKVAQQQTDFCPYLQVEKMCSSLNDQQCFNIWSLLLNKICQSIKATEPQSSHNFDLNAEITDIKSTEDLKRCSADLMVILFELLAFLEQKGRCISKIKLLMGNATDLMKQSQDFLPNISRDDIDETVYQLENFLGQKIQQTPNEVKSLIEQLIQVSHIESQMLNGIMQNEDEDTISREEINQLYTLKSKLSNQPQFQANSI